MVYCLMQFFQLLDSGANNNAAFVTLQYDYQKKMKAFLLIIHALLIIGLKKIIALRLQHQ